MFQLHVIAKSHHKSRKPHRVYLSGHQSIPPILDLILANRLFRSETQWERRMNHSFSILTAYLQLTQIDFQGPKSGIDDGFKLQVHLDICIQRGLSATLHGDPQYLQEPLQQQQVIVSWQSFILTCPNVIIVNIPAWIEVLGELRIGIPRRLALQYNCSHLRTIAQS